MSEDVARVVGSSGGDEHEDIIIGGIKCVPRALSIKELGVLERSCVKQFVRNVLETYKDNADLLDPDDAKRLMREKIDEVSLWDVTKLPTKEAHDPKKLRVNDQIEAWAKGHYEDYEEDVRKRIEEGKWDEMKKKRHLQQLTATALDDKSLKPEQYEKMTGFRPAPQEIGYVNWWVTGSFVGMLEMTYTCFMHSGITKDQLSEALGKRPTLLIAISREIEHLSAPQVGNM
jgi:hypothetical protein